MDDDANVDEAMRRLRAADPAADVDGTWSGPPDDELLAGAPFPRRRVALLTAVTAAAAVVVVAVALVQARQTPSAAPPPHAGTTTLRTQPVSPPIPADPKARTEQLLTRLLNGLYTPAGARRSATAPDPRLRTAMSAEESSEFIDQHQFWTARGTVAGVLDFFRSHPPDGLLQSGTTSDSAGRRGLLFTAPDRSYARDVVVLVSAVAHGNGVAIRVDAQAIWRPGRSPATLLSGIHAVKVTVTRHEAPGRSGAATVHRTLTGANAQLLVHVINNLPGSTLTHASCPAAFAGITDHLDFVNSDGVVAFADEDLTGCGGVTLRLTDGSTHDFEAGELNSTLMLLLGLPKNYGLS